MKSTDSFRTDLGPSPNREIPRPNEDTEFGRRLMAAGERLRYEPSAVAYHPLQKERVSKRHLLAWWFDYGRASVRQWRRKPDVWGVPRYYSFYPEYDRDMPAAKDISVDVRRRSATKVCQ